MTIDTLIENLEDPDMITIKYNGYTINRVEGGFTVCNNSVLIDTAATVNEVLEILSADAIY